MPPFVPAAGYGPIVLEPGIVVTVVNGILAGGSGTALSQVFTVGARGEGADRNVEFTSSQVGGVTTLTVDLEVSSDGGVTWQKRVVGIQLIAASVATSSRQVLMPGLLYRFNIPAGTPVAGGTSASINAAAA